MNTDRLVVPLTGALSAAVVLAGVLVAYYKQKDALENNIAEISKGMGELQAGYEIRISNLETAKNTDFENRLARVEEMTSTAQVTDWNQWRGQLTIKISGLESWRLQMERLFETNRDSVNRAWNQINKFHGGQ